VVKQSGGSFHVESAPNAGSIFRIFLPRHATSVEQLAEASKQKSFLPGTETLLLVEDDADVRRLICELLSNRGYRVLEAANGKEALRMIDAVRGLNLLITDVVMPDMSGTELSRQLRRNFPDLRVLYISGSSESEVPGDLDGSFAEFLQKPFTPEDLARKVRVALEGPSLAAWA